MIKLGVNVDHVATHRQARLARYPDPVEASLAAERAGANAITVHLREDRQHIQDTDLFGYSSGDSDSSEPGNDADSGNAGNRDGTAA